MTAIPASYAIDDGSAKILLRAVHSTSMEERYRVLARHQDAHGPEVILHLFSQFMSLAISVANNCHVQTGLVLVTEGGMHPHQAEQINLPTIVGALQGVLLANAVDASGTCSSCAFRLATPANQSPSTTADAEYCSDELKSFFCHKRGVMQNGALTRRCIGDAKIQKRKPHD
jgi:hypothetical protein